MEIRKSNPSILSGTIVLDVQPEFRQRVDLDPVTSIAERFVPGWD